MPETGRTVATQGIVFPPFGREITTLLQSISTAEVLVFLAGLTYVVGYLVINQIVLRLLILAGTIFYIAFYATVADTPLWGAIYISLAIVVANLIGLFLLTVKSFRWFVPVEFRPLYEHFKHLQPGDFRQVVRMAERIVLSEDTQLSAEGQDLEHLYFVLEGQLNVEKKGEAFDMPSGVFVGEVAFLLRSESSATTRLEAGGEVLVWSIDVLRRKSARSPRFKLALEAMISRDLARKVSLAVAPADRRRPMMSDYS